MAWWRHNRLAQALTIVMLLWTAADLANSGLCALENEDPRSTAPAATCAAALDQDAGNRIPPQPARPHIDDCFCCSHCVELHALVPALVSLPVDRELPPLVLAAPRHFGSRLYHPPLV